MKNFKFIISLAAVALIAGGCSTLRVPYNQSQDFEISETNSDRSKPAKSKSKKKKNKNDIPNDRKDIHTTRADKTYSPKDLEQGVVTGDWTIEEVNGRPAVGESTPYLKMVPQQKKVYGSNGCNTINASYIYNQSAKQLQFNDIVSTMRMCGTPGITDSEINEALAATRTYSWDHEGIEYYLYFYDSAGNQVMKLMHQNFDFLNGSWNIIAIDNEAIDDPDMDIVIDIDQGKIHGNTGCNIFNGVVDIDMETVNTINFHSIITTRMACPDPENQTRLIVGLEDAAYAKPIDSETVELLNLLRQPVVTLKRIH